MAKYIVFHGITIATDFVPETFGRLTTIGPRFMLGRPTDPTRHDAYQVCQCDCGNTTVCQSRSLAAGDTRSCGCLQLEGTTKRLTKHGDYNSPEYKSWRGAKNRYTNEKDRQYFRYGGRGIKMCDRWRDPVNGYVNFLGDMGRRPYPEYTLDRIDVNGNYCPENCRWATVTEQNRNMRTNVNITYKGKTQCISAWAEEYGLPYPVLLYRIKKNWNIERALYRPVTKYKINEPDRFS